MASGDTFKLVGERPNLALALSLSAPAPREESGFARQFTVEMSGGEFVVRSPLPRAKQRRESLLLCSKEAIATGLLLHRVWQVASTDLPDADAGGAVVEVERRLSEVVRGCAEQLATAFHHRRSYLRPGGDNSIAGVGNLLLEPNASRIGMQMKRTHVGDRVIPFHGDLMLAGDGPNGELLQLVARFTHDKPEWVRPLADYPSETLDILAS